MSALFPTLRNPPELGWDLPNLILKGPINPKYFQPETWAGLVKNDLGRQQFTKFIKNMVERMWSQAGTTDEVRAFADLLGDEGEWDLLSIGLTALKRVGAYDRKGPCDPNHFQCCLLWHRINEIIAGRQERINNEFTLKERESIPYDDRIHLRRHNIIARELFRSSHGRVNTDRVQRFKQSFEAFIDVAKTSGLNSLDDEAVPPIVPGLTIRIPKYRAPYLITTPKPIDIQDLVQGQASQLHGATRNEHGYLTSDHPYCQPVELNTGRPRRPIPPDIPDRIHLFDATGIPTIVPSAKESVSSSLAHMIQKFGALNDPPPTITNSVYGSNPPQPERSCPPRRACDSDLSNVTPLDTTLPPNRHAPPPLRRPRGSTSQHIPEFKVRERRFSHHSSRQRRRPLASDKTKRAVVEKLNDEMNDCPPADLLAECLSLLGVEVNGKEAVHALTKDPDNNPCSSNQASA